MRAVTTAGAQGAAQPLADHGCVAADRGRRHGLRVGLVLVASVAAVLAAGCGSAPRARPSAPADAGAGGFPRAEVPAPESAQAVTLHALGLVGTPYRYGGNTPEAGFDCSGLIGYVYWHSARTPAPRTVAQLSGWGQSVRRHDLRTGDLVVFHGRSQATHAGIYVGEGRFVHAPSTGGTVRLDHLGGRHWRDQIQSYRRP